MWVSANGKVHHSNHVVRKIASELKALWKNKGKGKNAMKHTEKIEWAPDKALDLGYKGKLANPENPVVDMQDIVDAALDTVLAFIDGQWKTYLVQEGN